MTDTVDEIAEASIADLLSGVRDILGG